MKILIAAKDLRKSFDGGKTFALDGVTVDIRAGEFIAIIGLSGAGKSTFLRSINGTLKPTSGAITVLGSDVASLNPKGLVDLRRQIGFIFQQFNLVKSLTLLQNVLHGRLGYVPLWRALTGFFTQADKSKAQKALDSVGLSGRYWDKVRNLSGGQQQRVAIARALVQDPQMILADEPMASLDPKLSEVVLKILDRENREQGTTILVNIHVLEYAQKYAQRILAFQKGKIVFDGPPSALTPQAIEQVYKMESTEGLDIPGISLGAPS